MFTVNIQGSMKHRYNDGASSRCSIHGKYSSKDTSMWSSSIGVVGVVGGLVLVSEWVHSHVIMFLADDQAPETVSCSHHGFNRCK